ncbi:nuclear transcription factor Y subunit C-9-like [Coffea eugenioides]|uniref:nuclear transcription factor Y subunit C-9-like n=1 Tax=Coffea eugenioides TaxID=49369 RepID=UPI000F5C556C|nr:nuclear transcription factor Y subunit C-9-like [Coffea arabica]XP_027154918.1 nuclear transcription factor Y subunit C-9-like [Coffea eugenioides]XP_027158583.1 nuclear transcription factor Y subunit C-9-like [Coffea eugenioides]
MLMLEVTQDILKDPSVVSTKDKFYLVPQFSGIVGGMPQLSYAPNLYDGNPGQGSLVTSVGNRPARLVLKQQGVQLGEKQQQQSELEQQLQSFWANQRQEIERLAGIKSHNSLPYARMKKIMKAAEDATMVSAEAPIVFAKACVWEPGIKLRKPKERRFKRMILLAAAVARAQ